MVEVFLLSSDLNGEKLVVLCAVVFLTINIIEKIKIYMDGTFKSSSNRFVKYTQYIVNLFIKFSYYLLISFWKTKQIHVNVFNMIKSTLRNYSMIFPTAYK